MPYIRSSTVHSGMEVPFGNGALSMPTSTLAGLGSAAAAGAGARGFVTDATLALSSTSLATAVVGGGANMTPVYSNGTSWLFG